MKPTDEISITDIEECLNRSGYLMESRLVQRLDQAGYFVEPNQAVLDPRTGKSREIDIVAEYYDSEHALDHKGVCVKTYFVIEAINTSFPFVLLTRRPSSPNANIDDYIKWAWTPQNNHTIYEIDPNIYERKYSPPGLLFSQFCQITRKASKSELMAHHSDDAYGGLLKVSEYIEDEVSRFENLSDSYWRIFFWRPILVISGQLFTVDQKPNGTNAFSEVDYACLEFNWHAADRPRTTVFDVVREGALLDHMARICQDDFDLERQYFAVRLARDAMGATK